MIVRQKQSWFSTLFIWNGSVLPRILPRLTILFLISVVAVYFHTSFFVSKISLNPVPFTLTGIALAIFLGFRNSTGYDRFWEGRKLWGALLNDTRSFIRQSQSNTTLKRGCGEITIAQNLLIALLFALKHQLRQTDASSDLQRLLGDALGREVNQKKFKSAYCLHLLGDWLRERSQRNEVLNGGFFGLDSSLTRISDSIGGCERIASTPIPYPYTILLHRTVYIYCFALPFGLVESIGWMTPFFSVFIAYTFIALDEVVNQIEDPFGFDENDLALDAMAETIEISIIELGSGETRESIIRPTHYRLS